MEFCVFVTFGSWCLVLGVKGNARCTYESFAEISGFELGNRALVPYAV